MKTRSVRALDEVMIVGLCRFSFLTHRGWKETPATHAERMTYLFTPEKIERRFALFQRLLLPSLLGQTDDDFRFVFLSSVHMPAHYQERLMSLASDSKFTVRFDPPGKGMVPAISQAFNEEFPSGAERVSFRIDDDDALSIRYVEKLRETLRAISPSLTPPLVISYPKGLAASLRHDRDEWAAPHTAAFSPAGMAMHGGTKRNLSVHSVGHHKCYEKYPTLLVPTENPMFLRGFHEFQSNPNSRNAIDGGPNTETAERAPLADFAERYSQDFPFLKPTKSAGAPRFEPS